MRCSGAPMTQRLRYGLTQTSAWRLNMHPSSEKLMFLWILRRLDDGASQRHDRPFRRIGGRSRSGQYFLLDVLHEVLNLALRLFHALAHLQDDRYATDVYSQVAR